jgi:NAD(P)-dependent dehydrogenase (short-subunit alcohol dehydrogenase family)
MKKALVIGGSSDIGSAIVIALTLANYEVAWTYCNTTRQENPGQGIFCDLRDMGQVKRLLSGMRDIDLMVTAALPFIPSENLDFEGYLAVRPFLDAHVYAITSAKTVMSPGGRIINMLGQSVELGFSGCAFNAGAFAFLHNLGKSINSKEGQEGRLSICDFLLGPVETRIWNGHPEEKAAFLAKAGRFIQPEEVAKTVLEYAGMEELPTVCVLNPYH